MVKTTWVFLVVALSALGCGEITTGGATDSGDAAIDTPADAGDAARVITVDQACTDLNTSLCNAIKTCSTFLLQLWFGDVPTCIARSNLSCTVGQNATGVGRTLDDLEACAGAVPAVSCGDLVSRKMPAACQDKPGAVGNGLPCGASTQCQSTFCRPQAQCGVCAPREAAGGNCMSNDQCNAGLTCSASSGGTCANPGDIGARCDDKQPCRDDLYCNGNGACAAKVGAGGSCADTDKACDLMRGVGCNPISRVCQTVRIASKGEACGLVSSTLVLCAAAGACETGTCVAAAGDGESCGPAANGRSCLQPASCAGGVCRLPATPSCN